MILIPKHRDIDLEIRARMGLRGHFKLEAVGLDGRRRLLAEFPNLITTNGGNLFPAGGFLSWCSVGSGNTPPVIANTTLQTFVAATQSTNFTNQSTSSTSPYFGTYSIQYAFAIGAAAGNLSEVGVGASSGGTNLFSRALILDGSGNPTTITVLSSEALYVTYQLSNYVPLTDVTGSVSISGTSYSYTMRAANATTDAFTPNGFGAGLSSCNVTNGVIGSITSQPNGTQSDSADSVSTGSYSSGSFVLTATAGFSLTRGNLSGGISAILWNWGASNPGSAPNFGQYQTGLSPSIPKDGSHTLVLNTQISWLINTP